MSITSSERSMVMRSMLTTADAKNIDAKNVAFISGYDIT